MPELSSVVSFDPRMIQRNPVLGLPAVEGLLSLPEEQREVHAVLMNDLAKDADERAKTCWDRSKAPMAAYWRAVSTYAKHISRALRHGHKHVLEAAE